MQKVLVLGVGAFAHSMTQIMKDAGAEVACYLTREYGHYGPRTVGGCLSYREESSPMKYIRSFKPSVIIPMSINWATEPWADDLLASGIPVLCPFGEALNIEASRAFAETLCKKYGIPTPASYFVANKGEALEILAQNPMAYVIKNPLCSPFSPVHTIVCETEKETTAWLELVDFREGVFLQEYLGIREAGHFAFIVNGEVISLATNQEYKKAFTGNQGPVAGAPMGGIVEKDPSDKYGFARDLIHPLAPWFKETNYTGPIQVTAVNNAGVWYPIEYNTRLGVTSGAMFLRMMENPCDVLVDVANSRIPDIQWKSSLNYGCSITLAGYGYPYFIPSTPKLPITLLSDTTGDLWWNEVDWMDGQLYTESHKSLAKGHRIADVVNCSDTLQTAIDAAMSDISKIKCLSSYYRTDIGQTLWPPDTWE